MSSAVSARGVVLKMGTVGSPASLATIAEVKTIAPPRPQASKIDVSNLDTVGAYKEFIAGWKDPGEMTVTANFLVSHVTAVVAALDDQVVRTFTILFPLAGGNKTATFSGTVLSAAPDAVDIEGALMFSFTVSVTGDIVYT